MCILCDSTCEDRACAVEEPLRAARRAAYHAVRPSAGRRWEEQKLHDACNVPFTGVPGTKSAPMGPWQSCTSWRDAWPSLSLGARTQVELLDAILGAQNSRRATSRSDIWTRVRAVESAVSSRRCIAKGCPHVRHPWLRRERFGMMRPSWGLWCARGGALAPNACTLEPYLCDAALNHT